MTITTHNPCCSSHGVDMDCAKYRRTHFVEVGDCCDAWARQHPRTPIPDDAAEAFRRVKTVWGCEPLASDHYALEAAAPLIVAAAMEQLAAQYPDMEFPETVNEITRCAGAGITLDGIQAMAIRERLLTEAKRLRGGQS